MAVAPSVRNSTSTHPDDVLSTEPIEEGPVKSPTSLILQALKDRNVKPTNANIRAYIEANAREGGRGVAGLVQDTPSTDSGPNVGQRGSAAKKVESDSGNPPNVDLGKNPYGDEPRPNPTQPNNLGSTPSNVATPSGGPPIVVDPGSGTPGVLAPSSGGGPDWLDALLPAGIAALIQGAQAIPGRGDGFVGNSPIPPTGRVMDVNPPAIGADGIPTLQVTAQQPPAPPPSPMEMSMQNAMRPALGAPGPNPAEIIGAGQQLPAGINPMSVPTQPTGPSTQVLPQNVQGAPRVPLRPGAATAVPMLGAGAGLGQRILRGLRLP